MEGPAEFADTTARILLELLLAAGLEVQVQELIVADMGKRVGERCTPALAGHMSLEVE